MAHSIVARYAWNKALAAEALKASGRIKRRTLKFYLHENNGFLNSSHTNV